MLTKFYVVEKDGIPLVWQSEPARMVGHLKRKAGYAVIDTPSDTRREALVKLRQRFPGSRPLKSAG